MMLTQQWRYLNLTRNSFYLYFLRKVLWVKASHFQPSLRSYKRDLFIRWPSIFNPGE